MPIVVEAHGCPGWTIGYFTPLCAGGLGTKENMHWVTVEDARLVRHLNGKNCKNVKGKSPPTVAYQAGGTAPHQHITGGWK